MQTISLNRLCATLLITHLFVGPAFAQETYSLRGDGLHAGVSYTEKGIFKMSMNGEKSFISAKSTILVKKVDSEGEIISATLTFLGDPPTGTNAKDEDPLSELYNKPLYYEFDGKEWNYSIQDNKIDASTDNILQMFGGPKLNRSHLPLISVPVGYKWEVDASESIAAFDIGNTQLKEMFKGLKGKATYTFDSIKTVNGSICAIIKSSYSYKGSVVIPDSENVTASAKLSGKSTEVRRLDNGLCIKLENSGSFSASFSGGSFSMDSEGVTTRVISSE